MNTEEVIRLIKESKKRTVARGFVSGDLKDIDWGSLRFVGSGDFGTVKGDLAEILAVLEQNGEKIDDCEVEVAARNSAVPLADLTKYEARIEPGAIIRDLRLCRPIYGKTAAYGHFGRPELDLPWERLNRVDELKEYLH